MNHALYDWKSIYQSFRNSVTDIIDAFCFLFPNSASNSK